MRGARRIAEFIDRVRIGQLAQADELADPLSPVQLQLGGPVGEQKTPKLAVAEEMIELGGRDIDQEQHQYPDLDRGKAVPREGRNHVRQKLSNWIVLDQPEPNEVFEQARNEYDGPVEHRFEQDRLDQRRAIVA